MSTPYYLAVCLSLILFSSPLLATTLHVPADYPTIQAAIMAANEGDTVLVAPGIYTGEGNREIELLGKNIAVIGAAGAEQTTIDGEGVAQYGFYLHQEEDTTALIKGFRIINVTATGFASTAIRINRSSPTIADCLLEENARGLFLEQTDAIIDGCTIYQNTAGGGILTRWSPGAMVRNCLIAENHNQSSGGGIRVDVQDSPTFINCTIVNNTAANSGGGIAAGDDELTLRNCIVWGNEAPEAPNLEGYVFDIMYSDIEGICWPQVGNFSTDPEFADDQFHLAAGSPCIDAGDPADGYDPDGTQLNMGRYGGTPAAAPGNTLAPIISALSPQTGSPAGGTAVTISGEKFGSQAGSVLIGGVPSTIASWSATEISCTTGAREPGPVTVEVITGQSENTNLTFGYRYEGRAALRVPANFATIQEAIFCATDGDTIWVAPGIYAGEGNREIELLGKNIAVIGEAGAEQTTIDGEGVAQYGFYLHQEEDTTALIKGFRIINVTATGFASTAIRINRSSPTIADCLLEENARGLFLEQTDAIIDGCTIYQNTAGGGILTRWSPGAMVRNCLIAENHNQSSGGGIRVDVQDSPTFINCTIVNNTAANSGGGIAAGGDELTLRNCIVWGNEAPEAPNLEGYVFDITYSDIEGICWPQVGNFSTDPEFADDQFHLAAGSPCIDAGDPADGYDPDGTQLNMGRYSGTPAAAPGNTLAPIISALSPPMGSPAGGTAVTISGEKFGSQAGSVVIGGVPTAIASWSATEISCTTGAREPGPVTVEVITAQSENTRLTFGYRYEGGAALRVPANFATIQEAIYCATAGDTVWVAPGIYTGEGNRKIELLGKNIAVIGEAGAEQTTIDGEGSAQYGFYLHQDEDTTALIRGFNLINTTAGALFSTAAIYIDDSSPRIEDCIIDGNARGIFMTQTDAVISGCNIRHNTRWGGILTRFQSSGSVIRNCLITDNYNQREGGGVVVDFQDSPLFINCTIANNTAADSGGGIAAGDDKVTLRNCIVWGNDAPTAPQLDAELSDITYSTVQGGWPGEGNLSQNPCFVSIFDGDYHLSPASPAIDAGDPADDFGHEPTPNGGRINMGRYGNTPEAAIYEPVLVIRDFDYEPGCAATRTISLFGKNFGTQQASGQVKMDGNSVTDIVLWTDTLIQFTAAANSIVGSAIEVQSAAGLSDSIPADYPYTPFVQYVEGEVSGVWTADCPGTYILTGSVTVPSGQTLTIEPGVTVLVDRRKAGNNAVFRVEGTLDAAGTSDNPILFSILPFLARRGGWSGIELDMQGSNDQAGLTHCVVEYARNGVTVRDSDVSIDSCLMRYNTVAGVLWEAERKSVGGQLSNSQLRDNSGYGLDIQAWGGSSGSGSASPQIFGNEITHNGTGGVTLAARASTPSVSGSASRSASASPNLTNNTIRDNNGFGIACEARGDWADGIPFDFRYRAYASPRLENNLIVNNTGGLRTVTYPTGGGTWLSYSEPKLVNCTMVDNTEVGVVAGDSAVVTLVNTILVGSLVAVEETGGRLEASFSTILPSFGGSEMVDAAPQFFDAAAGDYRLLAQSPQIDAGNNEEVSTSEDLLGQNRIADGVNNGEARVDIGAVEYILPQIVDQTEEVTLCSGESFALQVEAVGMDLAYQWRKDGTPIAGAEEAGLDITEATIDDSGSYTCLIRDELEGEITSLPITVTVTSPPVVTLDLEGMVCFQEEPLVLTGGSPSGGVYGGDLVEDGVFQVSQATPNSSYMVTYTYTDEFGCSNQTSEEIVVRSLPEVMLALPGSVCADDSDIKLTGGSPAGGVYSGDLVENGVFQVSQATPNSSYMVTYIYTDEFGCSNQTSEEIVVRSLPEIVLALPGSVCVDDSDLTLSGGSPAGGVYGGDLVEDGVFRVSQATPNSSYTITYTYTDEFGCSNQTSEELVIRPLPEVALALPGSFCADDNDVMLTGGSPAGGVYGGDLVEDGVFQVSQATPNSSYTITYTYTDEFGCGNQTSEELVVRPLPEVALALPGSVCVDDSDLTLSGGSPAGGVYGGDLVEDGVFRVSQATPNSSYTITYTYTDEFGCSNQTSEELVIRPLPEVALALPGSFCADDNDVMLTGGSPAGGVYGGDLVEDGVFQVSQATPNSSYAITYTYTDEFGCSNQTSEELFVRSLPEVMLALPGSVCADDSDITLAGGSPAGGIYGGDLVEDGVFKVSQATPNSSYTITYTYTDEFGCGNQTSEELFVRSLPEVALALPSSVCVDDSDLTLSGGSPAGGVYGGDLVEDGVFRASQATPNSSYTITYTYTDEFGCGNQTSEELFVRSLPEVALALPSSVCVDDSDLTLSGGSPAGGVYGGDLVEDGIFRASQATPNTSYMITYTYTDEFGCSNQTSEELFVRSLPEVALALPSSVCVDDSDLTLSGGSPAGGVYGGDLVEDGIFRVSQATPNTSYMITYTYTDEFGCSNQISEELVVRPLPEVVLTLPDSVCVDENDIALSGGSPAGGVYGGDLVEDGVFRVSQATPNSSYAITYTYMDEFGCSNQTSEELVVRPLPEVALALPGSVCTDDSDLTLSGGSPAGGVYGGDLVEDGVFRVSQATPNSSYMITYTYTDEFGCSNQTSEELVVRPLPEVALTLPDSVCVDENDIALSGGSPAGGVYGGDLVEDGVFQVLQATPNSSYTITYTFTDEFGCSNEANASINVKDCMSTSVSHHERPLQVTLFPVPTSDRVQVRAKGFTPTAIRIYTITGQLLDHIEEAAIQSEISIIDCSRYAAGVYLIQIHNGQKTTTKKLLKH